MELHQLRYLVAVAETGNFTRAAERSNVTQPSLSQQIINLEKEVGHKLFHRLGRKAILTEAGGAFLERARRILFEVDSATKELSDSPGLGRRITVGAIPTVAPYLLPPLLARCRERHPNLEIQIDRLNSAKGVEKVNVKPQVDQYNFSADKGKPAHTIFVLAEGRLVNLGCATGHPSFVMSNSFANQTLAQLDLWKNKDTYKIDVYTLPKHLDEEVARLHLEKIGVKLTTLTPAQADYLGVAPEGPYKPDTYRY